MALALQLHEAEQGEIFPAPCQVVSHKLKVAQPGKFKIPNACEHFGLSHIRLVKVFETAGWSGH